MERVTNLIRSGRTTEARELIDSFSSKVAVGRHIPGSRLGSARENSILVDGRTREGRALNARAGSIIVDGRTREGRSINARASSIIADGRTRQGRSINARSSSIIVDGRTREGRMINAAFRESMNARNTNNSAINQSRRESAPNSPRIEPALISTSAQGAQQQRPALPI